MIFANLLRAFAQAVSKAKAKPHRVIDLTHVPPNPAKTYGPRDASDVELVVVHVTAVRGGFGVLSKRVASIEAGSGDKDIAKQLKDLPTPHRLHALMERYSQLPYHWMAVRAGGGLVVHNHTPSLKTIHGHTGNRGIGWAVDCDWDEVLEKDFIEVCRESLGAALLEVHNYNGKRGVFLAPHRIFSNTRDNDPGPLVWNEIVLPVCKALPFVKILYDHCEGTGKPIPNTWDARSRFDEKGKLA